MASESPLPRKTIHDELRDARREIKLLQHQAMLFTDDHNNQIAQVESHFSLQLSRAEDIYNHQVSLLQDDLDHVRAERTRANDLIEEERKQVKALERERKVREGVMEEMTFSLKRAFEESGELRRLRAEESKNVEALRRQIEEIGRERDELVEARDRGRREAEELLTETLRVENEMLKEERDTYLRERDVAMEERGELRTLRAEELKKVDMLQGEMEEIGREGNELVAEREGLQMEAVRAGAETETLRVENEALKAERDGYLRERDVAVEEGKALELEKALREISRLETDANYLREDKEHCLDGYYSAIEGRSLLVSERDTARLERDDLATEKDRLKKQRDSAIQQRDSAIQQRDSAIQQRDSAIQQRDSAIQKRDRILKELTAAIGNLRDEVDAQAKGTARIMEDADAQRKKLTAERDTLREENDEFLKGRTSLIAERDTLRKERDALTKARDLLRQDMKRLALAATGTEVIGRGVVTGMGDFPQRTFVLAAEEETTTAKAIENNGSESMSGAETLPQEKSTTREESAGAEAEPIVAEIVSPASKAVEMDVRQGNVMPDTVEVASSQDPAEHAEDNGKEYNDGQNISSNTPPKKVTVSFKTLLAAHKLPFKDLMPGWLKMVEKTLYASRAYKRWRTSPSRYEEDIARVAYKKSPTMRVGVMYWVAGLVMRRVHHISLENLVSKYQLDQRNLVCLDSQMTYACKAEREIILEARQLRDPTFIQATEAKIKAQREVVSRSKRAARRASSSQRNDSQITSSSSTPQEPLDPPNIPRKRKTCTSSSSPLLATGHETNNCKPLPDDAPHPAPRSAPKRHKICTDPVEGYRTWTDAVASYIVRPGSELRVQSSEK